MENPNPATPGAGLRARTHTHTQCRWFFFLVLFYSQTCSFHRNTTRCPLTFAHAMGQDHFGIRFLLHRGFPGLLLSSLLVVSHTFPAYSEDTPCVSYNLFYFRVTPHHVPDIGGRCLLLVLVVSPPTSRRTLFLSFLLHTNSIITIHRGPIFPPGSGRRNPGAVVGKRNGSLRGCAAAQKDDHAAHTRTHTHTTRDDISSAHSQRHGQRGRWLTCVCVCVSITQDPG